MLHLNVPGNSSKVLLHSCCAPCSGAVLECLLENGVRPVVFFSNSNIVPREEYELRLSELRRYCAELDVPVADDEYDHEAWLDYVLGERGTEEAAALALAPERGERCLRCFKFRLLRAARYASEHGLEVLTTTLASSRWKSLQQVDEAGSWACSLSAFASASPSLASEHSDPGESEGTSPQSPGGAGGLEATAEQSEGTSPQSLGGAGGSGATAEQSEGLESVPQKAPVIWWPQNWRRGGLQPRRAEIICEQNFYNQTFCGCEFSRK